MKKPKLGTTMYFVCEHLYYVPNHAGPLKEFCVCSGMLENFFTISYTELVLHGLDPDGFGTTTYIRLSDIGKKVFFSPAEAAKYAEKLTMEYETAWSWLPAPEIPLRRTWQHYLQMDSNP